MYLQYYRDTDGPNVKNATLAPEAEVMNIQLYDMYIYKS
jgi:hypothetical protein